jgi:hypothetical protein
VTRQSADAEHARRFLGCIGSLGHPPDDTSRGTCFAPSRFTRKERHGE